MGLGLRFCVNELLMMMIDWLICAVATPKQIRELMKVDGLTNDEVKSHLQVGTIGYSFLSCSGSLECKLWGSSI